MAIGQSGRIVMDIEPSVKRALHARLAGDGRHLKEWFLERVAEYVRATDAPGEGPLVSALPRWKEPTVLKAAERVAATDYSKRSQR